MKFAFNYCDHSSQTLLPFLSPLGICVQLYRVFCCIFFVQTYTYTPSIREREREREIIAAKDASFYTLRDATLRRRKKKSPVKFPSSVVVTGNFFAKPALFPSTSFFFLPFSFFSLFFFLPLAKGERRKNKSIIAGGNEKESNSLELILLLTPYTSTLFTFFPEISFSPLVLRAYSTLFSVTQLRSGIPT